MTAKHIARKFLKDRFPIRLKLFYSISIPASGAKACSAMGVPAHYQASKKIRFRSTRQRLR